MPLTGFLFPGQGSQQAGMGRELLEDAELAELAERCGAEAGIDLRHLLVEADDEELTLTQNAQPALVFTGVALVRLLARRGIEATAAAGHSVGEYSALAALGALAPEQAVKTVVERGRAMAAASPPGQSSMIAVLGIGPEPIAEALTGMDGIWPANYNTPTQTVVGGTVAALEEATPRLLEAGARRVLPLRVAAAFHTPLVAAAGARLRLTLDALEWTLPRAPVVANVDAEAYQDATLIAARLEQQLSSPVRWSDCVRRLADLGCENFIEVGPKRALSGMIRELLPGRQASSVGTPSAVASQQSVQSDESAAGRLLQ
ncbi:MAG TPA: ACP S-malonyltransferase [Candidatus Dormibacteraeota bacterium]|nr:ACP S-malonyltransferase [Candidatus Dormibacteraeota bacterium]